MLRRCADRGVEPDGDGVRLSDTSRASTGRADRISRRVLGRLTDALTISEAESRGDQNAETAEANPDPNARPDAAT
jgi:hypothetical protein